MSRISIDPGLSGTGYAIWKDGTDAIWQAKEPPLAHGVLTPRYGGADSKRRIKTAPRNWLDRSKSLCLQLEQLLFHWHPSQLYCEWPQLWGDSEVSQASAKQRRKYTDLSTGRAFTEDSSDLFKLVALCGMYAKVAWENECRFVPVPVTDWKGQLPKDIVAYRIGKLLGSLYGPEANLTHDSDAIGIGLFCKGLLHPNVTNGNIKDASTGGNINASTNGLPTAGPTAGPGDADKPSGSPRGASRRLASVSTLLSR